MSYLSAQSLYFKISVQSLRHIKTDTDLRLTCVDLLLDLSLLALALLTVSASSSLEGAMNDLEVIMKVNEKTSVNKRRAKQEIKMEKMYNQNINERKLKMFELHFIFCQ